MIGKCLGAGSSPAVPSWESEGEDFAERPVLSREMLPAPWEQTGQKGALPVAPAEELAGHSPGDPTGLLWDAAPKSAALGVGWSRGDKPGFGSPFLQQVELGSRRLFPPQPSLIPPLSGLSAFEPHEFFS